LSWSSSLLTRGLLLFTSWTTDDLFIIRARYVYITSTLLLEPSMCTPIMTSRYSYNSSWVWLVNVVISYSVPEVRSVRIPSLAERYVSGFLPMSSFSLGLGRFHTFQLFEIRHSVELVIIYGSWQIIYWFGNEIHKAVTLFIFSSGHYMSVNLTYIKLHNLSRYQATLTCHLEMI
jgi:hypothetical protein